MSQEIRQHRRRRRPREEIAELLRAYDSSGLSQARFTEQNRIALTTFQWWLRRRREQAGGGDHAPALIPVTVRPSPAVSAGPGRIEVALANGRELRVPLDTDAARVAALVAALEA